VRSLVDRLNGITDLVSEQVEFFGKFSEEEKAAMRKRYDLKQYSSEDKELIRAFAAMAMELQRGKGYMNAEDHKELKKRFKP